MCRALCDDPRGGRTGQGTRCALITSVALVKEKLLSWVLQARCLLGCWVLLPAQVGAPANSRVLFNRLLPACLPCTPPHGVSGCCLLSPKQGADCCPAAAAAAGAVH